MTSCGIDMSKILQKKAVQFNQKGKKYKLITNNVCITKNTKVKIIQKYSNDNKMSDRDVYSESPRKLAPKM